MFNHFPSKVDPRKGYRYLNAHQFKAETDKCLQCPERPCNKACPCNVDPSSFILAATNGENADIDYAALLIYENQPLASVCGVICPVSHCMAKCSRGRLDYAINIPGLQAEIIKRSAKNGVISKMIKKSQPTGKKVAIVGSGPSGLSAAACLASRGHTVVVYEKEPIVGGDLNFIPKTRFPQDTLKMDVEFIKALGDVTIKTSTPFTEDMEEGYDAVIWAVGMQHDTKLDIPGTELSITSRQFLSKDPKELKGKSVCILGCGGVAVDCGIVAQMGGADKVTILYRRKLSQSRVHPEEKGAMANLGITVVERMNVKEIIKKGDKLIVKVTQLDGNLNEVPDTDMTWPGFDYVVSALGQKSEIPIEKEQGKVFVCGQARGRDLSAVQASASGKNAAMKVHGFLTGEEYPPFKNEFMSKFKVFEPITRPSDISTDFNGFKLASPFIACASPFTDTFKAVRKCVKHGFGGVVIGTGESDGYQATYRRAHPPEYVPKLKLPEALELIKQVKEEFPQILVASYTTIEGENPAETIKTLSEQTAFVQVDIPTSAHVAQAAQLCQGIKNVFITVNGQGCASPVVGFGAKTYKEAMAQFSLGAQVAVIDLSILRRNARSGEFLNRALSITISEQGCESLAEWVSKNKSFDIEEPTKERLVNHLTNPYVCIGCGRCTECPQDAIDLQPDKWIYKVDPAVCQGCGLCSSRCPTGACQLVTREEAEELSKKH